VYEITYRIQNHTIGFVDHFIHWFEIDAPHKLVMVVGAPSAMVGVCSDYPDSSSGILGNCIRLLQASSPANDEQVFCIPFA
jgi:hypothetical protein